MQIHYSFDALPEIKNPVVTTGSFDGVHIGHSVIISRLIKLASDLEGESVLVSFHPHPRKVLYPATEGKDLMLINSQEEKIRLLSDTGLDHLIIMHFTIDFARISCEEFVKIYLHEKLGARKIVIGYNHQFGFNREGNFDYLFRLSRELGFEVEEIPEQDIHNESVSSTKIRNALREGNIQRANAYLDHLYFISGRAEELPERSAELGFMVSGFYIHEDVKLVPSDGVYAVSIHSAEKSSKAVFSITGNRIVNGVNNPELSMEFHCISDCGQERKGNADVYFHKKIRENSNETDREKLKILLEKDIRIIQDLIY